MKKTFEKLFKFYKSASFVKALKKVNFNTQILLVIFVIQIIMKIYEKQHSIIKSCSFLVSIYFILVQRILFTKNAIEGSVSHCKGTEYFNLENQGLKGLESTHQFLIGYCLQEEQNWGCRMKGTLDFTLHTCGLI